MKKVTPNINFEKFGKDASIIGLLIARDLIDEQIRILQGETQEPEEEEQETPSFPENKIVSLVDFEHGSPAWIEAKRHNARIHARRKYIRDHKLKGKGSRGWGHMNAEERSKEMIRRRRVAAENRSKEQDRVA